MKTAQWIANKMYGYKSIFFCHMLNRQMINYSGIQLFKEFSKYFPKCRSSITNKSAPFERVVDFEA